MLTKIKAKISGKEIREIQKQIEELEKQRNEKVINSQECCPHNHVEVHVIPGDSYGDVTVGAPYLECSCADCRKKGLDISSTPFAKYVNSDILIDACREAEFDRFKYECVTRNPEVYATPGAMGEVTAYARKYFDAHQEEITHKSEGVITLMRHGTSKKHIEESKRHGVLHGSLYGNDINYSYFELIYNEELAEEKEELKKMAAEASLRG